MLEHMDVPESAKIMPGGLPASRKVMGPVELRFQKRQFGGLEARTKGDQAGRQAA